MKYSFQNIKLNGQNLQQEYGRTYLFLDQYAKQSIDEQEQKSAGILPDLLL